MACAHNMAAVTIRISNAARFASQALIRLSDHRNTARGISGWRLRALAMAK
jgi:hypothetical protein